VLLLEGYNDLAGGVGAVGRTVAAVREAVRVAKQTGVRFVFVATLTPGRKATGVKDRQLDPEAISRANAGIADVAAAESTFLVDMYAAFAGREQDLVHDDGLHPTAAGSQVLAETAFRAILSAVR
jgi:lysophospholipase L1-like esterase